jgi:type II secretory pathway pseudopilin PulG
MRILLFCRPASHDNLARYRQSGFTLIELLLIVVMIGVLSIAAINAFDGNEEQARENITRLEMVELQKALLQFRRDNRELPCRIYRAGIYNPIDFRTDFGDAGFIDLFTLPAGSATSADWQDWCQDDLQNGARFVASNGLFALNTFPYEIADFANLTWNRSSQTGWNGPYISQEALTDAWGNPYLLLEPELSYDQTYRCENDSGAYAIDGTSGDYICVSANAPGFNDVTDILPADIARIVSKGADGVLDSDISEYTLATDDPCIAKNDDFVLCLLR